MILVIDNYDSFTYNLVHYLLELGVAATVVRNDDMSVDQALAQGAEAILLSPGPCAPTQAGICLDLIANAPESLPIFGVCLGHQAIGEAFGGRIVPAKALMHGKISRISHNGAGLFAGLEDPFEAVRYHSLAVERSSLPPCLQITATSPDGEIMAIAHRARPVFGVQFHPESFASRHGHALIANFLTLAKVSRLPEPA